MRKIGILAIVGVLTLSLAGCGGSDPPPPPPPITGPGLVGFDDTSSDTSPLLTVTYTLPTTPGTVTVQILSDLASDGDIAFDPVRSIFTVTTGSPSVLFGIDSFNINFPEYRAFLTFPLDGSTGQPIVPGDAFIVAADVEVFVNLFDFASTVPTFLDLVEYPFRGLSAIDFDAPVLATRPVDFFASDLGFFVLIDVTSLMQAAQVPPALVDFQLRFSRDMSVPPLAPSSSARNAVRTAVAPPRAMEGIAPRQPATAKPLSPAKLAARRR
jgi:hypothetical protein